jgi:hypothetical protein
MREDYKNMNIIERIAARKAGASKAKRDIALALEYLNNQPFGHQGHVHPASPFWFTLGRDVPPNGSGHPESNEYQRRVDAFMAKWLKDHPEQAPVSDEVHQQNAENGEYEWPLNANAPGGLNVIVVSMEDFLNMLSEDDDQ